jgi:NTP pyrophosphatase (non-canonical NTP hydrolase)
MPFDVMDDGDNFSLSPAFFDNYQRAAVALASYPNVGTNMVYPALGIAGEAGEVADKVKKFWRNKGITDGADLTAGEKDALVKELGDVLWYIAALGKEIGVSLSDIAAANIAKLTDRRERGVINSEGDNR